MRTHIESYPNNFTQPPCPFFITKIISLTTEQGSKWQQHNSNIERKKVLIDLYMENAKLCCKSI